MILLNVNKSFELHLKPVGNHLRGMKKAYVDIYYSSFVKKRKKRRLKEELKGKMIP